MPPDDSTARPRLALAVADVNWFTTENLFRELEPDAASLLTLRCMDYLNGWRQGLLPWSRQCRLKRRGRDSFHRDLVLPSGWMKRFPRFGMRPIARTIRRFWDQARPAARPGLILTYPHYIHLLDRLHPEVSLYYNIDDYALYWPRVADEVRRLERQAVLRTGATVCVARARAEALRAEVPEAAERIHHLPHGSPAAFLAGEPQHLPAPPPDDITHLPRPLLGYVGSAERRVDWNLMRRLAEACPEASVVIVGRAPLPGRRPPPWFSDWAALAARPNVHSIGWRGQAELPGYYQSFDVILIPYRTDDPFNRVCSPTKIMDGMGSGRPIVATAIPECGLYTHLFEVAADDEAFLAAVASVLARGSDDGRADLRHAFAQEHSCRRTAERLIGLLGIC
jgi:glycosyltransferase involved in cell wall biosynthesis